MEVITFDENGNCVGANFMDYLLPTAVETPKFEPFETFTQSPHHPGCPQIAASEGGFMRVDVLKSNKVRLGVWVADETGRAEEAFSMWLE